MEKEIDPIIREALARMVRQQDLHRELDSVHAELAAEGRLSTDRPLFRRTWFRAAAAAVAVSAIATWWLWQPEPAENLYAAHFAPLPAGVLSGTKGAGGGNADGWVRAYDRADYAAAAAGLESCLAAGDCPAVQALYLGIARLELRQPEKALAALLPLATDSTLYVARRNLARFYSALAYVQVADYRSARFRLDEFLASENRENPFYEKAQALREALP